MTTGEPGARAARGGAATRGEGIVVERLPGTPGGEPSRLHGDFLRGEAALAPFFGPGTLALRSADVLPRGGSLLGNEGRALLVAAVRGQLDDAAPPAQRDAVDALASEATLAVVTGQQPGLFLGPLLTLYKAVTTIALARQLSARFGRTVVPIFWIVSEDDDLSEISETRLATRDGDVQTIRLFGDAAIERATFSSLRAGDRLRAAGAEIERLLPSAAGTPALSAAIARAAAEESPVRAFARLLTSLLGPMGLVVIDPADVRIKRLLDPIVARESAEPYETARAARAAGERLAALGYHAQIRITEDRTAFFRVEGGRRSRWSPPDRAPAQAASEVASLAPGVLIRPVCQDYLLPTIAYVGGPGEIAYFGQLGDAYARHGVPRPVLVPRIAATLVEPEIERTLDRDGLDLARLRDGARPADSFEDPAELDALVRPSALLDAEMARLAERIAPLAPPLSEMVEGSRRKIRREVERVVESARKQLDREGEAARRRFARARARLFPDGRLQERVLSPLPFLASWPELPDILVESFALEDSRPLWVRLPQAAHGTEPPRAAAGGEAGSIGKGDAP